MHKRNYHRYTLLLCGVLLVVGAAVAFLMLRHPSSAAKLTRLKNRGLDCLYRDKPDSALYYFLRVSDAYSKNMDPAEKLAVAKAINNAGYVYCYFYNDYQEAYHQYLKAIDVLDEAGTDSVYPTLYLNIGNIYNNYSLLNLADSCYRKSFYSAIDIGDYEIANIAITNMMVPSDKNNKGQQLKKEIAFYKKQNIPDTVELSHFLRYYLPAYEAYIRGDYATAIDGFDQAMQHVDIQLTPERYTSAAKSCKLMCYEQMGQLSQAVAYCDTILDEFGQKDLPDICSSVYDFKAMLLDKMGLRDSAMRVRSQSLKIVDTLFNASRLGNIVNMKSVYEVKKKNEQVRQLRQSYNVRTTIVSVCLVFTLLLLALLCLLYRKSRRERDLLEGLYQKALDDLHLNTSKQRAEPTEAEHRPAFELDEDKRAEIYNKVVDVMEHSPEIYSSDFSAGQLAVLVGCNQHYVSMAISQTTGKNFNQLLGEYRVKEVCRRLIDKAAYGNFTLEAISADVGFKSRTNFVSVFKKVTGLSPSEFRRMS